MWIFAPGGLLMPSTFPADKVAPGYLDEEGTFDLQVRVRAESHLTNFIRDFLEPMELAHSAIQATPHMDYNFRLYMSKKDFATAMAAMIFDIDYDKFKPTAERRFEDGTLMYADGKEYHGVLNSIWGTVCRLGRPGGFWGPQTSYNPGGYTSRDTVGRGSSSAWWDRQGRDRSAEYVPDTKWWEDDEFGVGSVGDQIGADLDLDDVDFDGYTPSTQERRLDALLVVDGIPASQWDEFLTAEEMVLVKREHEAAVARERRESRKGRSLRQRLHLR